ncbi:MAG: heparinase II/III domain-containing protein, partial [Planctomycetota bacterium]
MTSYVDDSAPRSFYPETRRVQGIELRFDRLSGAAEPGDAVEYHLSVSNRREAPARVRLEAAPHGGEAMSGEAVPAQFELPPGAAAEGSIRFTVSRLIPPAGFERHRLRVWVDDEPAPADAVELTTARRLGHPYLLHDEAGWEQVRRKARDLPWAGAIARGIEASADAWTVPEIDPSGKYVFEAGLPTSRVPFDAGVAWKLTGERRFADKVADFLLKLSDPRRGYPKTRRGSSRYAVKQGQLFQQAAILYDLLADADVLDADQKRQVARTLRLFLQKWARSEYAFDGEMTTNLDDSRIGNHHLSVVTAAVTAALALQDLNYLNRFLWGPGGFERQMAHGIMDDGWWFETDPQYHLLVAGFCMRVARACEPWGYNLYDLRVHPSYGLHAGAPRRDAGEGDPKRLSRGPRRRNFRTLRDLFDCLVPLADHRPVVFANNKSREVVLGPHFEPAYARFGDPRYAWVIARRRRGREALLFGVDAVPEAQAPRPTLAMSENAGLYVLRSRGDGAPPRERIQAVVKAGSHGHGHGHFDQTDLLSIMRYGRSFYRTQPILSWDRDAPLHNAWLKASANHNMVLVDQGNQDYAETAKLVTHDGELFRAAAVQAVAPWVRPDGERTEPVRHRRVLLVTDEYLLVADAVGGAGEPLRAEHTFDWMIHPVGLTGVDAGEKSFLRTDAQFAEQGAGRFITDCHWYACRGPVRLAFEQHFRNDPPNVDGVLKLDVRSVWPQRGQFMLGTNPPGSKPAPQPRRSVSFRTVGAEARYLTVIEPYETAPAVADARAEAFGRVTVKLADGTTHAIAIDALDDAAGAIRISLRATRGGAVLG